VATSDHVPYRGIDDALVIVRWAMELKGVFGISIEPGRVKVHRTGIENDTPLEPMPSLPSDNLLERIRTGGQGFGMGHIAAPNRRDALMVAMAFYDRSGLFPTHFLCHSKAELCELLMLPRPGEGGLVDGRTTFGWEVVADAELEEGTLFLCAGPRRGGSIGEVTAAIRLEGSD